MGQKRKPLISYFILLDMFGRPFEFLLPDNKKYFKSMPGAMASFITIGLMMLYGIYRITLVFDRTNYQILSDTEDYGV